MAEGYGDLYRGFIHKQGRALANAVLTPVEIIAAPSAGWQLGISKISVSNSSATDVEVTIFSGLTAIWTLYAPNKGGNEPNFPDPIWCADASNLNFTTSASVSTVTVSAAGIQRKTPLSTNTA